MGWAKYSEDIMEIVCERQSIMENERNEAKIKPTYQKINRDLHNDCKQHTKQTKLNYKDKTIVCLDCGKDFLFPAKSQKYFASRNWKDPIRCKSCREFKSLKYIMCASF